MILQRLRHYFLLPWVGTLLLWLSACGFHLQTTHPLPPQLHTLYIQNYHPYSPLARQIKSNLKQLNVSVVNCANQAPFTLDILAIREHVEAFHSTLSSISTRPYLLTSSFTFTLTRANGCRVIKPITLTTSRHFILPGNVLLENSDEVRIAKEELRQVLIELLLDRLSSNQIRTALAHTYPISTTATVRRRQAHEN